MIVLRDRRGREAEAQLVRQHVGGAERHDRRAAAPGRRAVASPFTTSLIVPSPPATAITA